MAPKSEAARRLTTICPPHRLFKLIDCEGLASFPIQRLAAGGGHAAQGIGNGLEDKDMAGSSEVLRIELGASQVQSHPYLTRKVITKAFIEYLTG